MAFWERWLGRKDAPAEVPAALLPPAPTVDVEVVRAEALAEGKRQGQQEALTSIVKRAATPGMPGIYSMGQPSLYYTMHSPNRHPGSPVSVETLRQIADQYDVLRACINHLKREMQTTSFAVVPRDEKDKSDAIKARCALAMALFEDTGTVGGIGVSYQRFEAEMLEDVLVVGAGAIYHQRTRAGNWYGCEAIDAATIVPLINEFGWAPPAGSPAYAQYIWGVETGRFTRDELSYDGIWSNTRSPYFVSPVEWLIQTVNTALRSDLWNQAFLTDGNTPDELLAMPKEWTPDQVIAWSTWWNGLMSGNTAARRSMKFVPGGSEKVSSATRKEQDFASLDMWLLRRTCAIMGVQAASIGFVGEQYKVTQDASMRATRSVGVGSLLTYRRLRLDDILARAGFGDLRVTDASDQEQSAREKAETLGIKIGTGQITVNEARQEQGLDAVDGGDVILVPSTLTTLELVQREPEPMPGPGEGGDNGDPQTDQAKKAKTPRVQRKGEGDGTEDDVKKKP